MICIHSVHSPDQINAVRVLLGDYARLRNYDAALGDIQAELEGLPGKYAPPEGALLLAMIQGQAAGCVALRKHDDTACEMKRLYVSPEFQGRGLGKALVEAIIDQARHKGYQRMLLDTHPWMYAAMQIYQQAGFREIAAYRFNPTPGIRFFELTL